MIAALEIVPRRIHHWPELLELHDRLEKRSVRRFMRALKKQFEKIAAQRGPREPLEEDVLNLLVGIGGAETGRTHGNGALLDLLERGMLGERTGDRSAL